MRSARVNVYDMTGALAATSFTETTNFCWIAGPRQNCRCRYEVIVKDDTWAEEQTMGLDAGRDAGSRPARRPLRQRVPHASDPAAEPAGPFTFMVVGDYGTGIRRSTPSAASVRSPKRCSAHSISTTCG